MFLVFLRKIPIFDGFYPIKQKNLKYSTNKYVIQRLLIKFKISSIKKSAKIAVMGCVVNGPGEASSCDFGVAGGKDKSAIFAKGKVLKVVENDKIV